ncbi:uncharacterized protein LOC119381908 [Rhipicephalus sanguineus]|uniref:uncharacterized protein LOC119381908 n=1 Tax=Rhipicephalus sanguineus TaxID=34632 RepID=UPI0020C489A0|nr:uncharacterized protein LOC119381908 [Rhipicephalus sanguineus]
MPHACDVVGCPSGARRQCCSNETDVSFHWVPQNEPLRSKWLSVMPLRQCAKESKTLRVCSLHFRAEDYETNRNLLKAFNLPIRARLCPTAVPSVFPESESHLDTLPELSVSHDLQQLLQDDDATECTESGTTHSAIDICANSDAKVAVHAETQTDRSSSARCIGNDKSVQVRLHHGTSIGVQVNLTMKDTKERGTQMRKRKKAHDINTSEEALHCSRRSRSKTAVTDVKR